MDGATLLRDLRQILTEPSDSAWLDVRACYDFLWEAAIVTADRTTAFRTTQTITTALSTSSYNLNPDFLRLSFTDNENRYYLKYNNGTSDTFLYFKEYDAIILGNNTTAQAIPNSFTIVDASTPTQITGTATTPTGSLLNSYTIFGLTLGTSLLTASAGAFTTTNLVSVGDIIHNTTDGSHGIVLAIPSATTLTTALFDGAKNYWTISDTYIINPQGRYKVVFDPPCSTASHTVTVYYVQRPSPVYDYYGAYGFTPGYKGPLVFYAAWKYKYRDREPNFGDAWYQHWDFQVRLLGKTLNAAMRREGFKVNLIKKADRTGSRR